MRDHARREDEQAHDDDDITMAPRRVGWGCTRDSTVAASTAAGSTRTTWRRYFLRTTARWSSAFVIRVRPLMSLRFASS